MEPLNSQKILYFVYVVPGPAWKIFLKFVDQFFSTLVTQKIAKTITRIFHYGIENIMENDECKIIGKNLSNF